MSMKSYPARLAIETYPLVFQVRSIYTDMDVFRHINNGATGRYFEEGRALMQMQMFGVDQVVDPSLGHQTLLVSITTEFFRQAHYPGDILIATGCSRVGNSSYLIAHAAFQNGECFSLADATMVKAKDGCPVSLSDKERAAMASLMLGANGAD